MYTPNHEIIKTIFGSILNAHLATISDGIKKMSDDVIESTIYLFQLILKDSGFSPSAKRFHYQFNFRELSKVIEGVCRSRAKECGTELSIWRLWAHEC